MRINNEKRKLYNLLISEIEKKYGHSSEETVFVIKSEAIAMLQREYIKNIRYISACLKAYFDRDLVFKLRDFGASIILKEKKEYKYMTRSHLAHRWGPLGRKLIDDFLGAPDKIGTNKPTPTQFYLKERVEEIENSIHFKIGYIALYHDKFENLTIQDLNAAMKLR